MRLDTAEDIQKCLSCDKPRCNNCLYDPKPPSRMGRPRKAVGRQQNGKTEWFDGVVEAAKAMNCTAYMIRTAIKTGRRWLLVVL